MCRFELVEKPNGFSDRRTPYARAVAPRSFASRHSRSCKEWGGGTCLPCPHDLILICLSGYLYFIDRLNACCSAGVFDNLFFLSEFCFKGIVHFFQILSNRSVRSEWQKKVCLLPHFLVMSAYMRLYTLVTYNDLVFNRVLFQL